MLGPPPSSVLSSCLTRLAPDRAQRECRHESLEPPFPQLTRRQVMRLAAAGALGASASGWIEALAADAAGNPNRRKSCILLWMSGGPSQTDTFDPKPGHANSGPFKPIETAVPGMLLGPHLPKLAKQAKDLAIIRSMSSKEGDHGRATYYLRTGYLPQGPVRYPTLGSLVANEFDDESAELPGFVSISPVRAINAAAFSSGFLGPKCAPLNVGERALAGGGADAGGPSLRVEDLDVPRGIGRPRADERLELMHTLGNDFLDQPPRRPVVQPPERLPPGREDDAVVGRQGVRPGRGARRRARRLRPQPVRPGLPAGPPAGRARRAVRRGDALLASTATMAWAGTRTPRISTPSRSSAASSTPAGPR